MVHALKAVVHKDPLLAPEGGREVVDDTEQLFGAPAVLANLRRDGGVAREAARQVDRRLPSVETGRDERGDIDVRAVVQLAGGIAVAVRVRDGEVRHEVLDHADPETS